MAAVSRLRYLYRAYAAKPRSLRRVYREIKRRKIARIVELGVGSPSRARQLIEVAQRFAPGGSVSYAGFDRFDARVKAQPTLRLIDAHRGLAGTGARIRLVPGELAQAIAASANTLSGTDLLLLGPQLDEADLFGAWFYVPRMLHAGSLVLRQSEADDATRFEQVALSQIEELAASRHQAAA